MMTVGSASGAMLQGANSSMPAGSMQMDSVSRNLQNQIANEQQKLKELSSNDNLTPEEKMKKRQEIQQEIANLQQQLRQHQMEQKREQRKEKQSKGSSVEELTGGNRKADGAKSGKQQAGLSTSSMQAMMSADSSVKQAKVQGSVATRMEGRAGVLKAEIKQDGATGGNTQAKEAELAEVEQKAMEATAAQANTLAKANKTMEEAAKAEQGNKSEEKASKTEDGKGRSDKTDDKEEYAAENRAADAAEDKAQSAAYTHVDVRL